MVTKNSSTPDAMGSFHFDKSESCYPPRWPNRRLGKHSDWSPQGFPVAPILFTLFIAPLFKLFSNENKEPDISIRGYVDDGLLTARHKFPEISVANTVQVFKKVEQWAYDNEMVFDPAKFEAIHFTRKRNLLNLDIELPPPPFAQNLINIRIVKPIPKTHL